MLENMIANFCMVYNYTSSGNHGIPGYLIYVRIIPFVFGHDGRQSYYSDNQNYKDTLRIKKT